ncbi:phosphatase PAP2 family protein [Candidatus Woesearchaeota archaeon]|nr:phosphatase PAP2 family protein [Candidatus Woesearchaeota archaeon]
MKHRDIVLIFTWTALIILSFFYDQEILYFIQSLKNPVFDFVFLALHYLAGWISILFFFSLYFIIKDRKKLKEFLVSYLLTMFLVFLLKNIAGRDRPNELDAKSFPSGHSAAMFSALNFISENYLRYWVSISVLVMVSRVYLEHHYMSDVLSGAFIGYFFTKIIGSRVLKNL